MTLSFVIVKGVGGDLSQDDILEFRAFKSKSSYPHFSFLPLVERFCWAILLQVIFFMGHDSPAPTL